MRIAVLADDAQKMEILGKGPSGAAILQLVDSIDTFPEIVADAYIDLQFTRNAERIDLLRSLAAKPVIVNSVIHTLSEINAPFARINAWPGMIAHPLVEVCIAEGTNNALLSETFTVLGWNVREVPDITGMVTPRTIAMIINEAWFVYGEGTSSKEEIDTAMKLGTNYPFGPFEWCDRIGINRVVSLLQALAKTDARYSIAPLLNTSNMSNAADLKY